MSLANQTEDAARTEGGAEINLRSKLGNGSGLDIVLISLANPPEEVDWVGIAEVPVERLQNVSLGLKDLGFGVRGIGMVEEVGGRRDMISSTLAVMNIHVIPTSCSLTRETTRAERKRSMMLTQRNSVSGSRRDCE